MRFKKQMQQLKLRKKELEVQYMELRVMEQEEAMCPHMGLPIRLYREGSRWVCILETDPEPLKCVIAYGESPAQACRNFDALWEGQEGFLIDQEEEEEEF